MVTGRGFEPLNIRVKGARVNQFHQPVMAGRERIELSPMVLETIVLPLNYHPIKSTIVDYFSF